MIQPTMGYCTMRQYHYFMGRVNEWERMLVDEGIILIKVYLSVPRRPRTFGSRCASPAI